MITTSETKLGAHRKIVAFLGSSSTAGKGQAFDWIDELKRRSSNVVYLFRNFGIGGDLAYNALQRLDAMIAVRPHFVVVWICGNDALAQTSIKVRRFFRMFKRLPVDPSLDWFRENIETIAHRLKNETAAKIAFCSLPPIGEDLSPDNSFQRDLNERVMKCNLAIQELAMKERLGYIPLYEVMCAELASSPAKSLTGFKFLPFYRDAFRTLVLRKTPDQVAQMNGWFLHTDGVHLNSRGGLIAANLVQAFIDGLPV
jgi:lysophospholipase L1-like esterase